MSRPVVGRSPPWPRSQENYPRFREKPFLLLCGSDAAALLSPAGSDALVCSDVAVANLKQLQQQQNRKQKQKQQQQRLPESSVCHCQRWFDVVVVATYVFLVSFFCYLFLRAFPRNFVIGRDADEDAEKSDDDDGNDNDSDNDDAENVSPIFPIPSHPHIHGTMDVYV